MRLQVIRSRLAEIDLLEICAYVGERSVEAVDRLLELVEEKCSLLASSPLLGTECSELAPELRYLTAGAHVIFYRAEAEILYVVRILHAARDVGAVFNAD